MNEAIQGEVKRGPGRPPAVRQTDTRQTEIRADSDSKARAAARLREIRQDLPDNDDGTDRFFIDPSEIPDGWSYEWKRKEIYGQQQQSYQAGLMRRGWEPVPQSRHEHVMVEQDGMILMERPKELTSEAHLRHDAMARAAIRAKEEQLGHAPAGTLPRDADNRTRPRINKSYEPVAIPDE